MWSGHTCLASDGFCEHRNEPSGFTTDMDLLKQLSDCTLLKADCFIELVKRTVMPGYSTTLFTTNRS